MKNEMFLKENGYVSLAVLDFEKRGYPEEKQIYLSGH